MASRVYFDRPSLWAVIITTIVLALIVTTGILVWFLRDEVTSRIVLITLICTECVLGICALTFIEIRRRKAQEKDKQLGSVTSVNKNYKYNPVEPSAPSNPNSIGSNQSTLQAR